MRGRLAGRSETLFLGHQHQLQPRQSQSSKLSDKAKEEGLEVSK